MRRNLAHKSRPSPAATRSTGINRIVHRNYRDALDDRSGAAGMETNIVAWKFFSVLVEVKDLEVFGTAINLLDGLKMTYHGIQGYAVFLHFHCDADMIHFVLGAPAGVTLTAMKDRTVVIDDCPDPDAVQAKLDELEVGAACVIAAVAVIDLADGAACTAFNRTCASMASRFAGPVPALELPG